MKKLLKKVKNIYSERLRRRVLLFVDRFLFSDEEVELGDEVWRDK